MLGKGALLLVIGVAFSFSVFNLKLGEAVLDSAGTFNRAYMETLVHETALNSMNLGINKAWNEDWTDGTFSIVANDCSTNVAAYSVGLDTIMIKSVATGQVYDHEYHSGSNIIRDSVVAYFALNTPMSRYFWFTEVEGVIYWISGDSISGQVHTNGVVLTSGSPVFYGKVTARDGINPAPESSSARYYGGWEIGLDISIPTDMKTIIDAATAGNGGAAINTKSIYDKETSFEFLSNGNVIRTVSGLAPDTISLSNLAPKGVITSTADVRIQGILNGELTIYTEADIYIDDDIVYADDPEANPDSDDVLGLVSMNNVYITDNAANNNDCHIQASIMAIKGSFTAENYRLRATSGELHVVGGIIQSSRGPVGTFNSRIQTIVSGFSKRYRFDDRFDTISPPYFPFVRELSLVGWWE